jgi:hypothetical protein
MLEVTQSYYLVRTLLSLNTAPLLEIEGEVYDPSIKYIPVLPYYKICP